MKKNIIISTFFIIIVLLSANSYSDYSQWEYSSNVTLNTSATGANVSSTVYNFPVLLRLNANNFDFSDAKDNGEDLRFSKENGTTALSYHIERWDKANEKADVWVLVDTVYGDNSEYFFIMHWGNSAAQSESNSEAVFQASNNFNAVFHFNNTYNDATSNNNDAINTGTTMIEGTIGMAAEFDGLDSIRLPANAFSGAGSKMTIELVQYGDPVDQPQDNRILWAVDAYGNRTLSITLPWSDGDILFDAGNYGTCFDRIHKYATDPSQYEGQFNHWAFIKDATAGTMKAYVNGSLFMEGTGKTYTLNVNSARVGAQSGCGLHYDGYIDELRISKIVRSEAWIKLSYENQRTEQKLAEYSRCRGCTAGLWVSDNYGIHNANGNIGINRLSHSDVSLAVNGLSMFDGAVGIGLAPSAGIGFNVAPNSWFGSNVEVHGNMTLGGSSSGAAKFEVVGTSLFKDDITINGTSLFNNDIKINGVIKPKTVDGIVMIKGGAEVHGTEHYIPTDEPPSYSTPSLIKIIDDYYHNSVLIGTSSLFPNFIRIKPTVGSGIAITGNNDDIGLFVSSSAGAKVGIGTTNIGDYKLAVDGNVKLSGGVEVHGSGDGLFKIFDNSNGNALMIGTDDDDVMKGFIRIRPTAGTGLAITGNNDDIGLFVSSEAGAKVGIGTTNTGSYKLAVEGTIGTREIVVTIDDWADHVFSKNFQLKPLSELEKYINENGHLPNIPTEQEVKKDGLSLGDMQSRLLEKIEEMTLYLIKIQKENDTLKDRISDLA